MKRKEIVTYSITGVCVLLILLSFWQQSQIKSQLRELDQRLEMEFSLTKDSLIEALKQESYSAKLAEKLAEFEMQSLYGYYLSTEGISGDPQWCILSQAMSELKNQEIFEKLTKEEVASLILFLETHDYSNDPAINEAELESVLETIYAAVHTFTSQ